MPDDATREVIDRYWAEARAQDELLGSTPRVEAYGRSYFLFRGPLSAACTFEPSGAYTTPNLWWPDDPRLDRHHGDRGVLHLRRRRPRAHR